MFLFFLLLLLCRPWLFLQISTVVVQHLLHDHACPCLHPNSTVIPSGVWACVGEHGIENFKLTLSDIRNEVRHRFSFHTVQPFN